MSAHFGNAFLELGESAGTGGASAGTDGTSVTLSAASPEVSALVASYVLGSCGGSNTSNDVGVGSCALACPVFFMFQYFLLLFSLSIKLPVQYLLFGYVRNSIFGSFLFSAVVGMVAWSLILYGLAS